MVHRNEFKPASRSVKATSGKLASSKSLWLFAQNVIKWLNKNLCSIKTVSFFALFFAFNAVHKYKITNECVYSFFHLLSPFLVWWRTKRAHAKRALFLAQLPFPCREDLKKMLHSQNEHEKHLLRDRNVDILSSLSWMGFCTANAERVCLNSPKGC